MGIGGRHTAEIIPVLLKLHLGGTSIVVEQSIESLMSLWFLFLGS
jgi:hypothetical protein